MPPRHAYLVPVVLALAGCASSVPFDPPTEAEVRGYVAQVVDLALSGDLAALCDVGGGNCEDILAEAGPAPDAPPVVADMSLIPNSRNADGSWTLGGQLVEICGRADDGSIYRTQMIVFRDYQGRLIAIEPIYWSGIGIVTGGPPVTTGSGPLSFNCPLG